MLSVAVVTLRVALQTPDKVVIAAVRAAVDHEPIEAFGAQRGSVEVRNIALLDVDGDNQRPSFGSRRRSVRPQPS